MVDKTTKTLLLVIAIGLWANVASNWTVVTAQRPSLERSVSRISTELSRISRGTCPNSKLC